MSVVSFPSGQSADHSPRPATFPPGLVGDVADFIYRNAPYPDEVIALAGGIAFVAGITGRAFNVETSGLNQYVLLLAATGRGKEAVADGIARLMAAVYAKQPRIADYRGPGELVSAPGLFKWLDKLPKPVMFCIIGEFGLMLKAMASPNANANMSGLQRVLLHLWSKSGRGAIFDASAYSDRDKNTRAISHPSLTVFGEGVPESFYATLDESMVTSGLLPRTLLFETTSPKPYRNANRIVEPSAHLVDSIARLVNECGVLADTDRVKIVALAEDAARTFEDFGRFAVDQENSAANDQMRGLWARLHLKALKLAALIAVGRNFECPLVSFEDCMWATNLVVDQTNALIGKFESGETGEVAGDEVKQVNAILKIVFEYITGPYDRVSKYGITYEMHRDKVFSQSYLSRRIASLPTFRNDRVGATNALKRVLAHLLEGDEIKEIPKAQMQKDYGITPRSFAVSRPQRFFDTGSIKSGGRV